MATVIVAPGPYVPAGGVTATINTASAAFSGLLFWVPGVGSPIPVDYTSTTSGPNLLLAYLRVPNVLGSFTLTDNASVLTFGSSITTAIPVLNDPPITDGVGGYLRWRPRMVRLSVFEDIKTTLTDTGWIGGSTNLTYPVDVKEFFPEFAVYAQDRVHVNTLTIDNGEPTMMEEYELGGIFSRDYRINMAMYAQDNETGQAIMSDLGDRFLGLTEIPYLGLYNYNVAPPILVVRMEITSFMYTRAALDVSPYEHHLFYAELMVRDFVDSDRTVMMS